MGNAKAMIEQIADGASIESLFVKIQNLRAIIQENKISDDQLDTLDEVSSKLETNVSRLAQIDDSFTSILGVQLLRKIDRLQKDMTAVNTKLFKIIKDNR